MSPIPLGILAASGVDAFASSYDFLEEIELSANTAEIDFTNLVSAYSSDYRHLQIRGSVKTNQSDGSQKYANGIIRLNGDSGANYSHHRISTTGSTPTDSGTASASSLVDMPFSGNLSAGYSPFIVDIPDAFVTTKYKTAIFKAVRTENYSLNFGSGNWRNNNAIDRITFDIAQATTFKPHSKVSLYGLKVV